MKGGAHTTTGGGMANITARSLASNEPALSWIAGASTAAGPVAGGVSSDGNGTVQTSLSKRTNRRWYAVDNINTVATITSSV